MALFRISSERKLVSTSTITALSSIPSLLSLSRSKTTTTSVKWNRSAFLGYVRDRCQSDTVGLEEILGSFYVLIKFIHSPSRPVSINHFDQLLGTVYRMRNFPTAFSLWRAMQFFGIQPSPVTVNILTNCACSIDPGVDLGFAVFGMSLKRGIGLKVATLSTLLTAVFQKGDPGQWNVHVRKAAEVIDSICTNGGRAKEALHLVEEISRRIKNPTLLTYTSLFHSLCISGQWKEIFAEYLDVKILPDPPNLCDALIDGLCSRGMIPDAHGVFDMIIERGFCPTEATFHLLMRGFCLQGLVNEAKAIFDLMVARYHKPTALAYRILIDGYCLAGRLDEAVILFLNIRSKGLIPDSPTYTTLLRETRRVGGRSTSKMFSEDILDNGLPPLITYRESLFGIYNLHYLDEQAKDLLLLMQTNGSPADTETFYAVMVALRKAGKLGSARCLFYSLIVDGMPLDKRFYNIAIEDFSKTGKLEEAWSLLNNMKENGVSPNCFTLKALIEGCLTCQTIINETMEILLRMSTEDCLLDTDCKYMLKDIFRDVVVLGRSSKEFRQKITSCP